MGRPLVPGGARFPGQFRWGFYLRIKRRLIRSLCYRLTMWRSARVVV